MEVETNTNDDKIDMDKSQKNSLDEISETSVDIKYPILGYAPGYYTSKCSSCKEFFMGDKYSRHCKPCAINELNEGYKQVIKTVFELKTKLEKIQEAFKKIKDIK